MKRYVMKRFKEVFGELLLPLGFKMFENCYYRVVNDVAQLLFMVYSQGSANVEITIDPLARKCPTLLVSRSGDIRITCLTDGKYRWELWHWNEKSIAVKERGVNSAISEMRDITRECVIPCFDIANSCKTALPELTKLAERCHVPLLGTELWMSLKNGDFPRAVENLKKRYIGEKFLKLPTYKELGPRHNSRLDVVISRLEKNDTEFVNQIIAFNEAKNREFYLHPSKGCSQDQPYPWDFIN